MDTQPIQPETEDLETRIIRIARDIFVEKGFSDTSMSEIAERVGINRPTLHYYFRTKERLFHTIFSDIISVVIPRLHHIITRRDLPLPLRIGQIVDTYYALFLRHPYLPLFMMREINRDVDNLLHTITTSDLIDKINLIRHGIEAEMAAGTIRTLPLRHLFYTFYGLLLFPLITRPAGERLLLSPGETFPDLLTTYRPYIISQLTHLLTPTDHP